MPFFATGVGAVVTIALGTIAAVLSVLKPVLGLSKKIERASKLWSGYSAVFNSAKRLVRAMQVQKAFTAEMEKAVQELHDRIDGLCADDDPCPKDKLIRDIQDEVDAEIDAERWWCPPASSPAPV